MSGDNVLLNWRRVLDEQSDWTAKVYYDQSERHWPTYAFGEDQNTFDFDFQYRFPLGERNEVICGTGYRNVNGSTFSSNPTSMLIVLRGEHHQSLQLLRPGPVHRQG